MINKYYQAIKEAVESEGIITDDKVLTGFSGHRMVRLLQNVSKVRLDSSTCYVEVGVFQGLTLLSVAKAVENAQVYGIDNFAFFDRNGKNLSIVNERTKKLQLNNVNIINQDYEDALEKLSTHIGDKKVGVYFVDGPHDYRSQLICLELIKPFLADDAIIIIDDCNYRHVRQANRDFLFNNKEFKLLFQSYTKCHPLNLSTTDRMEAEKDFWNGVNVIVRDKENKLNEYYPPTLRNRKNFEQEHELHASKHPDTIVYFLPLVNLFGGLIKKLSKKSFAEAGKFNSMNTYSDGLPKNDFNKSF